MPAISSQLLRPCNGSFEKPGGTARRARIDGIEVCGKTGTARKSPMEKITAYSLLLLQKKTQKSPLQYTLKMPGLGGTWAAPISSLLIEKYLTDSISDTAKQNPNNTSRSYFTRRRV